MQAIAPQLALTVALIDLCELDESEQGAEVLRLSAEEALRPFDLARRSALASCCAAPETARHRDAEHASHYFRRLVNGVLLKEVGSLYDAYANGESLSLPVSICGLCCAPEGMVAGDLLEEHLSY